MLHRVCMTVLCVVVLGVCTAAYVSVQPPKERVGYTLEFYQGTRTRQTADRSVVDGLYSCTARDDPTRCLQDAGRDVCAKDEAFEILEAPTIDADGKLQLRYRCTISFRKPAV